MENKKKAKDLEMAEEKAEGVEMGEKKLKGKNMEKTTGFNNFPWLPPEKLNKLISGSHVFFGIFFAVLSNDQISKSRNTREGFTWMWAMSRS